MQLHLLSNTPTTKYCFLYFHKNITCFSVDLLRSGQASFMSPVKQLIGGLRQIVLSWVERYTKRRWEDSCWILFLVEAIEMCNKRQWHKCACGMTGQAGQNWRVKVLVVLSLWFKLTFSVKSLNLSCVMKPVVSTVHFIGSNAAFLKLWSADHKWSSGSALVVLLDWTLLQKRQQK